LRRQLWAACGIALCGCALVMLAATATAAPPATHFAAAGKEALPAIPRDARKLPIDVASSHVDYKGDTVVFQNIVITQGDTRVQADHAHATDIDDFQNSRWTFEGNVRINGEQHGSLHSDQAVVEFRNNHISKATINGNPAEFEQRRADNDQTARGRAQQIVYDLSDGTVVLSNGSCRSPSPGGGAATAERDKCDAWLSDGHNEISGPQLVYNIREARIQASTQQGSDERVHIILAPHSDDEHSKNP
jgi:lipopolysaccharide export system protein LptA